MKRWQRSVGIGCGVLATVIAVTCVAVVAWAFVRDRETARYPGATHVSTHSNYGGLPFEYRWDDSYHTRDSFKSVYNWYSITFDLGAESRANGDCILLEGTKPSVLLMRYYNVSLCSTPRGQMIFMSRTTTTSWRATGLPLVKDLGALFNPTRRLAHQ